MEFRVLGPVELWAGGQRWDIGAAKERCALVTLLLHPGQPVTADTLIDHLWDGRPPSRARASLHSHIARLRTRLSAATGDRCIDTRGKTGMYVINVPKESIDLFQLERLRDEARAFAEYGDTEQALALLRETARLWRGEPLADVPGDWANRVRTGLVEMGLEVTTFRIELELSSGRHAAVVGELRDLVAEYPFDEKLIHHLMMALYRSRRPAEALEIYRAARNRITGQIGTDPGPALRDLQQRILNEDPELRLSTGPHRAALFQLNNLPRDIPSFTGRESEIQRLLSLLPAAPSAATASVTVITIDGMAGVGKTALAVHLAHRLTEAYPDAQLFLDLRAHNPEGRRLDPAEALDTALRRLGVPPRSIPGTLDDRVVAWRTQLARRRCVIVLDDAADHLQVRPLLPGSPGSVVLVTSRNRLADLEGVQALSLDVLPHDEAETLFARVVGPERRLEQDDLRAVIRLCGGLPLALELTGSRLKHRKALQLGDLVARLSSEDRISEIRAGDHWIIRDFDLSYNELGRPQSLAFRRLGLHPGTDFTVHSAAALADLPLAATEQVIEELLSRHLLRETSHGRYRFHDLLRAYAQNLAVELDGTDVLQWGLRSLLEHQLATTDRAVRASYPFERHLEVAATATPLPALETAAEAREWLQIEHTNLITTILVGYEAGLESEPSRLARALWPFLEEAGHWVTAAELLERALETARAADDPGTQAESLRMLAHAQWRMGFHARALKHAKEGLALYRSIKDRNGEAAVLDRICLLHWGRSDHRTAIAYGHAALEIRRSTNDRHGEAMSLMHGAIVLAELGRFAQAEADSEQALQIFKEIDDQRGMKRVLNNLGDLALRRDQPDLALHRYESAAAATPQLGRQDEAILLNNIGTVYLHTERHEDALEHFQIALTAYREIGDRRSEIDTLLNIGHTHLASNGFDEGLIHYKRAYSSAQELCERRLEVVALHGVADIHLKSGRHVRAFETYQQCRELAQAINNPYEEAQALDGMGNSSLHTHGPEHAHYHWNRALELYTELGATGVSQPSVNPPDLGDASHS